MQEGLIFSDLSDFKQDLLKDISTNYPKEIKKFIKQEARKCSRVAKKIAKQENVPLVLGSATPDLRTFYNAKETKKVK